MLTFYFPKLKENKVISRIAAFLYSDWYLGFAALTMVCANLFGLELPVYYLYLLVIAFTALFAEDMLPALPLVCCGYMTFSARNNPAVFIETSLFRRPVGYIQLFVIAGLMAVFVIARLVFELIGHPERRKLPRLAFGFLALGVSYVLGGAFSGYYGIKTVLFGLTQILSLSFFYFYFFYAIDWQKAKKEHFAKVFTAIGCGIVLEIVGMYFLPGVVGGNGEINRGELVTGWGMYNNVGCIMAMCLPAPFYFAIREKCGWAFNILGNVFLLAVMLTQSRNSILFGGIIYVGCAVFVLWKTEGRARLHHIIVYSGVAVAGIVTAIVVRAEIGDLFASLIYVGTSNNGRWEIYKKGIEQFLKYPIFGNGFYECHAFQWGSLPSGSFLPPRYHNTYVQLLASGGVAALAAYAYHRVQTALLFFRKLNLEKIFIGFSVLVLITTSFFDCHFFNFGPGLLYACLLVMAEKMDVEQEERLAQLQTENG